MRVDTDRSNALTGFIATSWVPMKISGETPPIFSLAAFRMNSIQGQSFCTCHAKWGANTASEAGNLTEHTSDPTPDGSDGMLQPAVQGRVVRGVAHVELRLASELSTRDFSRIQYPIFTRRMLDAVWDRDLVYDQWGVGQPYENSIYSVTSIEARDLRFRTIHTVKKSLRTIVWGTITSAVAVGGAIWIDRI